MMMYGIWLVTHMKHLSQRRLFFFFCGKKTILLKAFWDAAIVSKIDGGLAEILQYIFSSENAKILLVLLRDVNTPYWGVSDF